mmetsp:Transcript_41222/g.76675  ORF Transcript_41222/g.76675 Transcript_41222/m.76675 type:complete len:142 (-) Transcript_41222:428-853(-)
MKAVEIGAYVEIGFLVSSLSLNVSILTPICFGMCFKATRVRAWYGERTVATGILNAVYMSIILFSAIFLCLLFFDTEWMTRVLITELLTLQIVFHFLSPCTTEVPNKDRSGSTAVAVQLGMAIFHGITLGLVFLRLSVKRE